MPTILLVTVTKTEAQAVLEAFSKASGATWQRQTIGDKTYYALGDIGGADVYMVQSEMGTSTPGGALLTIHKAIQALKPAAVILVGIAFGSKPVAQQNPKGQHIGDILVAKQIMAYEPQKLKDHRKLIPRGDRVTCSTALLDKFRSADNVWNGAPVHFGLVLSGEKLITHQSFREQILQLEPEAIGGEMEGAGLYIAAADAKVDWILVKAICDWADGNQNEEAQSLAAKNAAEFVQHMIELESPKPPDAIDKLKQFLKRHRKLLYSLYFPFIFVIGLIVLLLLYRSYISFFWGSTPKKTIPTTLVITPSDAISGRKVPIPTTLFETEARRTATATNSATTIVPPTPTEFVTPLKITGKLLFAHYPDKDLSQLKICIWQGEIECLAVSGSGADWSPDGNTFAFNAGQAEFSHIYTYKINNASFQSITGTLSQNARYPAWSPDGNRLAYVVTEGNSNSDIYTVDMKNQVRQITTNPLMDLMPDWSPNVEQPQLLVVSWFLAGNSRIQGIFQINPDAPNPESTRKLLWKTQSTEIILYPAWSPTGEQIAFLRRLEEKADVCIFPSLKQIEADLKCYPVNADPSGLAWSPDGKILAYFITKDTRMGIELFDTQTGLSHLLWLDQENYIFLNGISWSP